MKKVIDDIGTSNEYILFGTNDRNKIRKSNKETEVIKKIGNINFQVFSPSEYVADDIADEKQDRRYQRIHEQCAVIRFSYGSSNESHIMITGDSDKKAWESHITNYHKKNLYSNILSASHHGSRTFFKESEDDENIYEEHYKNISPEYVVVSAPKQSESKHGHPHDDAINLYLKLIQKENILHLGKNLECAIVDINSFGELDITMDKALVEEYGFNIDKDSFSSKNVGIKTSQLDEKPMG
jgi:beta-lactamase superfamily II metal-dependent hydrolase